MNESMRKLLKFCLRILPDRAFISIQYKYHMGYFPDLNNPKTFNEKLQWLKLHDRKPKYSSMVDKYEAKRYVAGIIGKEHIIPTYGVWNTFDEICFKELPSSFVLKCTHDSGSVVICKDKESFDYNTAKTKIDKCMKNNFFWSGREWPYKAVKPRIIAEKYLCPSNLHDPENCDELVDYKFFCFNGKTKFLYISKGLMRHETGEISFYDLNGKEMPFHRSDYKPYHDAKIPDNFDQMIQIADELASNVGSPFVRVDLYSFDSTILFSELTFSPCLGVLPFEPKSADRELGDMLILDNPKDKSNLIV